MKNENFSCLKIFNFHLTQGWKQNVDNSLFFSFSASSVLGLAVNFDINTFTSKRSLQEKASLPHLQEKNPGNEFSVITAHAQPPSLPLKLSKLITTININLQTTYVFFFVKYRVQNYRSSGLIWCSPADLDSI